METKLITKSDNVNTIAKNKSAGKTTVKKSNPGNKKKPVEPKVYDPVEISKWLNPRNNHFIIYPTTKGYSFAIFWRAEREDPFEQVGASPKAYKLKSECIRTCKKLMDG